MEVTPTQVKLAVKSMSRFCVIASQAGVKLRKKETINKLVSNSSQQVQGLSFISEATVLLLSSLGSAIHFQMLD